MTLSRTTPLALAAMLLSAPALASSYITDPISNPSSAWAGIDYWGVQASSFAPVDQIFTFTIADDSSIAIFMNGSSKFQFTDVLLNGQSIASNFTVDGSNTLKASGLAAAGAVSLEFKADYTCADCWGDWFGGYVQVQKAVLPTPAVAGAVPEPASWAMMIAGLGFAGAMMRRRKAAAQIA